MHRANHDAGEGLIGDTVFLDRNGNGVFDAGEGLEGVTVKLLRRGRRHPGGDDHHQRERPVLLRRPACRHRTYVVQVQTGTLPYAGLTNTVDPDGGNNSTSTVNLAAGRRRVNLAQDFGYRDTSSPNTIGGTIWKDANADGTLAGESRPASQGVTVVLRNANGDIVATTTTDCQRQLQLHQPAGRHLHGGRDRRRQRAQRLLEVELPDCGRHGQQQPGRSVHR